MHLKIAHVTASLTVRGAGVKAVVEDVSSSLMGPDRTVRVFGLGSSDWTEFAQSGWHGAPVSSCAPLGPESLGYAPSLSRALRVFQPDIVHLHGLWLLIGHSVLRWHKSMDRPFVLSPHGMLAKPALSRSRLKKWIAGTVFQNKVLACCACMHATSLFEAEDIRAAGWDAPIAVIGHGIGSADSRPTFPQTGPRRILSLGRKAPIKGLDRLLRAWKMIQKTHTDWSLDIVGPDENGYETVLRNIIDDEQIKRVRLLPPVYGDLRNAAFCMAELFVLPSLSENFALTVAESLIRGVPVIATRSTPWSGIVDQDCGLWAEGSEANLAEALHVMLSRDARERQAMGLRGRAWMQRDFTWEAIAAQYLAVYFWLLGQGSKPGCIADF